jgi:hypothetical protein
MAPHCEGPDPAALIRHRYIAIKRTVPGWLDWITRSPTDCLDLVARFRLEEALEPNVTPSRHPVQEMRCPVSRVREAASRIPDPAAEGPALTACQIASVRAKRSGP